MQNLSKFFFISLPVCFLLAVLDQILKIYVKTNQIKDLTLIPQILAIDYSQNSGIAFSIPITGILLIFFTIILIIIGLYLSLKYLKITKISVCIVIGMILAGALSNLYDRIFLGYVVDFIKISIFPIFNLADTLITIGILIILIFNKTIVIPPTSTQKQS